MFFFARNTPGCDILKRIKASENEWFSPCALYANLVSFTLAVASLSLSLSVCVCVYSQHCSSHCIVSVCFDQGRLHLTLRYKGIRLDSDGGGWQVWVGMQFMCYRNVSDRSRLANQHAQTRHTLLSSAFSIRQFRIISFRVNRRSYARWNISHFIAK